jgi:hypothetical protein
VVTWLVKWRGYWPSIYFEGLGKTARNLSRGSRCSVRDSNRALHPRPSCFVLVSNKALCSTEWYSLFPLIELHHQHRTEADVSHSIWIPPGFPGPSKWRIMKQVNWYGKIGNIEIDNFPDLTKTLQTWKRISTTLHLLIGPSPSAVILRGQQRLEFGLLRTQSEWNLGRKKQPATGGS